MTAARKGLLILGGLVIGAAAAWALAFALSMFEVESGWLAATPTLVWIAVPFALVAIAGLAVARRPSLRPFAFGLALGAAAETAFLIWLFEELSRGLDRL